MGDSTVGERSRHEAERQPATAVGGAAARREAKAAGASPSRDSKRGSISRGAGIRTEFEAFLARKVHLTAGGKRSPDRAWRSFFTVLAGHLLCYFKDRDGLLSSAL